MHKIMSLPFKLAKEKSVAQLAAELARLRKEEKELEEDLKKEPHHSGRQSVYGMVRSSISSLTGKHRRRHRPKRSEEEGGRRRTTVKRTKMDRRRRR